MTTESGIQVAADYRERALKIVLDVVDSIRADIIAARAAGRDAAILTQQMEGARSAYYTLSLAAPPTRAHPYIERLERENAHLRETVELFVSRLGVTSAGPPGPVESALVRLDELLEGGQKP